MKTSFQLPDDLYRRVKAKSALEGKAVREVTIELYRAWLGEAPHAGPEREVSAWDVMKKFCGIVDGGPGDLATNPKHMEGFGRD
jgi:hypothetical protein